MAKSCLSTAFAHRFVFSVARTEPRGLLRDPSPSAQRRARAGARSRHTIKSGIPAITPTPARPCLTRAILNSLRASSLLASRKRSFRHAKRPVDDENA